MLKSPALPATVVLLGAAVACSTGRHSSAGFRLPADGDVERGKAAFVALNCHTCHEVPGLDLPRPTVEPAVPVILGRELTHELTDGYLVTSIINPSYKFAPYPRNLITSGGQSRMPHYADRITVRQITDIVAFLQSRFTVRPLARAMPYS